MGNFEEYLVTANDNKDKKGGGYGPFKTRITYLGETHRHLDK